MDRNTAGPKPGLARDLGAVYHAGTLDDLGCEPDIVLECTGAVPVIAAVMGRTAHDGIVCLTGVSADGRTRRLDLGGLNREMVLENSVVFGSVNANRRHYEAAAAALARADRSWLERLVTRRVPLERFAEALRRGPDDVKVVVEMPA
jgi:threonine dehydrogenase-like Zn-dependent dehydrogenase